MLQQLPVLHRTIAAGHCIPPVMVGLNRRRIPFTDDPPRSTGQQVAFIIQIMNSIFIILISCTLAINKEAK